MKIRDVMRPARWMVEEDTLLRTAAHLMARHRVRFLPVVDAGKLVGLLSERDVLAYRAQNGNFADWWRAPVAVAMESVPETTEPDDVIDLDRIAGERLEILAVVENEYLVGMISAADVLDAEAHASGSAAQRLDATAADAMTEHPWTCRPTDSLVDAAKLMVDYEVRHLPVIEDGELVGILSDRDIRTIAGDPARFATQGESALVVRDAMTANPVTVPVTRRVRDIASDLIGDQVGALPVVDEAGKLVGIISYVDALRALAA
jgi:CBS domain-containing protein